MSLSIVMMQRPIVLTIVAMVFVGFMLLPTGVATSAQYGPIQEIISLPEQGAKPLGFVVSVSCDDTRLYGDLPVTIQVTSTAKHFPADRLITIRISPVNKTTQPPGLDCIYELPIQLTEGTVNATKIAYLPKWSVGGDLDISVIEGRRSLEGYRGRTSGGILSLYESEACWWESTSCRFGWILENASDTRDARVFFASLMPELLRINDVTSSQPNFQLGDGSRHFRTVSIDALPTDWRGFDAVDIWIVDQQALSNLNSKHPDSAKALNDYIRCGGTLWILGSLSDKQLMQWFSLRPGCGDDNTKLVDRAIRSSMTPSDYEAFRSGSTNAIRQFRAPGNGSRRMGNSVNTALSDESFAANLAWIDAQEVTGRSEPIAASNFELYDLALGHVAVCSTADPLPGRPQQWRALANMSDDPNSLKINRRAIDPCFGDRRFWDWVIPGVAQPPVYTFIGLLITFVIVVGPLAYRKLTKLGRGYLMMFVAPLLAFATTIIMFAYGLVADGLSTRVRVREVTWIGDKSGIAARCNRATYFAGVRPADGLHFPANSIVLPYQLPSVSGWYEASSLEHSIIGMVKFDEDAIRFDSGFLPSRQQKQFVSYRPVDNVGIVRLALDDTHVTPTLISELSLELRQGVVRGLNGDYFTFDKLPSGATIELSPVAEKQAGKLLSELYGIQRPLPPAGVSSARRRGEPVIDLLSVLYNDPKQSNSARRASLGDNTIEAWLREELQVRSELPPGMFVAVADVTNDCISVDSAEVVESVHYVIGVLP